MPMDDRDWTGLVQLNCTEVFRVIHRDLRSQMGSARRNAPKPGRREAREAQPDRQPPCMTQAVIPDLPEAGSLTVSQRGERGYESKHDKFYFVQLTLRR